METYAQEATGKSRDYGSIGAGIQSVHGNDLGTIKSELERHVQRVREMRFQARDIGDSIFGSRPENASPVSEKPAAHSVTALLNELDGEIAMLSSEISRF